jgi:cytochrome c oxidase subunit IV
MSDHTHDSGEEHIGHVLPLSLLLKVFGGLVALTALTVYTGAMDLHGFDLPVAMLIATAKATLVCLFFMHLKYDKPFLGMIFLLSVLFVGLFLAFVSYDSGQYQDLIRTYATDHIGTP